MATTLRYADQSMLQKPNDSHEGFANRSSLCNKESQYCKTPWLGCILVCSNLLNVYTAHDLDSALGLG